MYAIIRTGGKQAKVHEGDVIDVEHLRAEGEIGFTPLLLVDDDGQVFSDRETLKEAKVIARVAGESTGPKVDLFKYKNKTGYRRHQGHRQRYTTLEVVRFDLPPGAKRSEPAEKPKPAKAEPVVEPEPSAPKATARAAAKPEKSAAKPAKTPAKPAAAAAGRKKKES